MLIVSNLYKTKTHPVIDHCWQALILNRLPRFRIGQIEKVLNEYVISATLVFAMNLSNWYGRRGLKRFANQSGVFTV